MSEFPAKQNVHESIAEIEMANCMLTDFAALVSHDIRSALRRVLSYSQLLAVVPALNAQADALNLLHAITFAARRIQFLADGALASPPQSFSFAKQSAVEQPENEASSLEQQLNDLRRANRELTDFADSVARGLRGPLEQILASGKQLGAVSVVRTNPVSLDMTEEILTGAKQMKRLVEDYLSFANTERHAIYRCRISLESLIQLVRHELEAMAAGRKVVWQIGPLPEVEADVSMLRQVLVNLLTNSLKYTVKCSEAVVEVGVRPAPDEHIIYIRDNGIGFDLESARNLFKKFVRLQENGIIPGVGVGLVIVKHIIQRHHGRVWAEPVAGGGAAFYFTLPKNQSA